MSDVGALDARARRPGMILTIARKEFQEIFRDGRFLWTAGILLVLLVSALIVGAHRYATYTAMQSHAQEVSDGQFYTQGDKNPHSGAHYGNYAFRQAGPLSFFDNGVDPYTGSFIFMEAHRQNPARAAQAGDTSALTRFGDLNGAMILQVLMPLVIIFLGFSAFAGERERGTLRQLLSMGVPRGELLWGKALGIGGAVALVIAPCIIFGAAAIALLEITPAGDAFGARLALLAVSYAGYAAIFLFVTLAVSAMANSPRTALIALVGFWAFSAFIMPKAAAEISKVVTPTPALGEFDARLQATRATGFGDGPTPRQRLAAYRRSLLAQYNVEDVADLPVYWVALSMQRLEEMDHEFFDFYYQGLDNSYLEQRRLQDSLGVFAPTLPLSSISMGLSGTDLLHQRDFVNAAERTRREMVARVNAYLAEMAAGFNANLREGATTDIESNDRVLVADEAVFRMVEPVRYSPPSLHAVLTEYRGAFLVLTLWLAVAIAAARVAVGRISLQSR